MAKDEDAKATVLRLINGAASSDAAEQLFRQVKAEWPRECKVAHIIARSAKMRFDEFKAAGFTDAQALALVMRWMWGN